MAADSGWLPPPRQSIRPPLKISFGALRSHYHPNYYAAYVLDLDGYKIEAVCHK
ncbi:MAG TPA: hypothetical protein V6D46_10530 [Coleofasciculaceae cyanobacterium]